MHPSSFITLLVLIPAIFAAPLNLTSWIDGRSGISTSSEDRPMPLQRRELDRSQTCVYWAVKENLGEKIEGFDWMYHLKKDFGGESAIVRRVLACTRQEYRTVFHEIINQKAVDNLIKVATEDCEVEDSSSHCSLDSSESTCAHLYLVTKNMGVPAKALKTQLSEPVLKSLRDKARSESQKRFKLVYSGDEEKNFVYRHVKGSEHNIEANIIGDWAFALPVGHADPGEPEIFADE